MEWQNHPKHPVISENEVHVWRVDIPQTLPMLGKLTNFLSPKEAARVARYRIEVVRNQHLIARAMLRQILSYYLVISPTVIEINSGRHGKPFLHGNALQFNLSHTGDQILYAITLNVNVGIDVENAQRNVDHLGLAKRFFSLDEYHYLALLSPALLPEMFFKIWTAKEAFVKAIGLGLHYSLKNFTIVPGKKTSVIRFSGAEDYAQRDWFIQHFLAEKFYRATVVVNQSESEMRYYTHCN